MEISEPANVLFASVFTREDMVGGGRERRSVPGLIEDHNPMCVYLEISKRPTIWKVCTGLHL